MEANRPLNPHPQAIGQQIVNVTARRPIPLTKPIGLRLRLW
jgi:hypothetical protein